MGEGQGEEREGDGGGRGKEGGRRGGRGEEGGGRRASCGEITMREGTPCRGSPVECTYEETGAALAGWTCPGEKKAGNFTLKWFLERKLNRLRL